jgi:carbon-monoxide dehydrogenase iron sulfur subunit
VFHEGADSRNRVVIDRFNKPAPIFCRHCKFPECVYTCMTGAMTKHRETGFVLHDHRRCAKCGMCIMACPYGVLKPDRISGDIMKCDMCGMRPEGPFCVEKCPMGAIETKEAPL